VNICGLEKPKLWKVDGKKGEYMRLRKTEFVDSEYMRSRRAEMIWMLHGKNPECDSIDSMLSR
jgi:hypothetical protein